MAAPIVFRSTDASAPTLSGTAGDLINLLNKCLVVGYGSGAAASGAGWSSPYGPTSNVQVFRPGSGLRRYFRVDDSGTTEGRGRGWEAMGSIADSVNPETGTTGPFPTDTQLSGGVFLRKSNTANATTRPWIVVADDRTAYVFVQTGDAAGVYYGFMFGDIYSYSLGGDNFSTALIGRNATGSSQAGTEALCQLIVNGMGLGSGLGGHYLARDAFGMGGCVLFAKIGASQFQNSTTSGNVETMRGAVTYPNPADGGLWIAPVEVVDAPPSGSGTIRGCMRGMFHCVHPATSFTDGDTFSGVTGSELDGRTFLFIKAAGQALVGTAGIYCIETTAWAHN